MMKEASLGLPAENWLACEPFASETRICAFFETYFSFRGFLASSSYFWTLRLNPLNSTLILDKTSQIFAALMKLPSYFQNF